ncbi:MAG: formate/nitrite transporter family protein [Candidatus Binataceae bacterium]
MDGLSDRQKHEVEEKSRPNAALIHETIRAEGLSELERTPWALALSGLSAGLSMGFSLVVQGLLAAALPGGPARALITPLGYTIGFLIVVLGRQQLFTENTLTPVLPLLHNRDRATLGKVMLLWAVVLAGNLVGTFLFALLLAHSAIFEPAARDAFAELARATIAAGTGATILKAIFAGWLIALLVWIMPAADSARPWMIIIVTYVVGFGGFSHVIAGSVECAYLVDTGGATWGDFVSRFFLPTLLGNILGGVTLVAALNYGQVAPEIKSDKG